MIRFAIREENNNLMTIRSRTLQCRLCKFHAIVSRGRTGCGQFVDFSLQAILPCRINRSQSLDNLGIIVGLRKYKTSFIRIIANIIALITCKLYNRNSIFLCIIRDLCILSRSFINEAINCTRQCFQLGLSVLIAQFVSHRTGNVQYQNNIRRRRICCTYRTGCISIQCKFVGSILRRHSLGNLYRAVGSNRNRCFRCVCITAYRQCACRQQRHYHDDCHHHSQQSFFHVDSPFHCRIPFRGTVASVLRIAPPPSDCSRRDSIYFASISILLYTPSSELAIEFSIFCHFGQNKAPHFSTFPAHKNKKQADARIRLFLLYLWQQYRCST